MDYALAKQLKDAGFPFQFSPDKERGVRFEVGLENPVYSIPALSELIEACSSNVYLDIDTEIGNEARKIVRGKGMDAKVYFGQGKDILEAVSNLYLELKDKRII